MTQVYLVQHVHEMDDGAEEVKLIGVYSSRETAEAAVVRLSQAPGFRDASSGFHIDAYQVDRDQWAEGFSTAVTERRAAV